MNNNEDVVCELMGAFHNREPSETEEISAEQQERLDYLRERRLARLREWGKVIDEQDNEEETE